MFHSYHVNIVSQLNPMWSRSTYNLQIKEYVKIKTCRRKELLSTFAAIVVRSWSLVFFLLWSDPRGRINLTEVSLLCYSVLMTNQE